jgi:hypothetical protein
MVSHTEREVNVQAILDWCKKHKIPYFTPNAAGKIHAAVASTFHFTEKTCDEYVSTVMDVLKGQATKAQ